MLRTVDKVTVRSVSGRLYPTLNVKLYRNLSESTLYASYPQEFNWGWVVENIEEGKLQGYYEEELRAGWEVLDQLAKKLENMLKYLVMVGLMDGRVSLV